MNKILMGLEFDQLIAESAPQTQTGIDLINKYRIHLMNNPISHRVVNQFIKEARIHTYDKGIYETLSIINDYLTTNKVSWALATACENINSGTRNYLDINAAKQVSQLLEMSEDNVVKYIRSGALKNVMFCESFRNIAKQVFKDSPMVEVAADYTAIHPISLIESTGDGLCFEVLGRIYKIDDCAQILEVSAQEVSNQFITISRLLESQKCTVDEDKISFKFNDSIDYIIEECGKVKKKTKSSKEKKEDEKEQEMTTEQFREYSRLVTASTTPRMQSSVAQLLESIALVSENYDKIANLDNVSIYTTNHDKFIVIESGPNMYATLISSTKHPKWTINESAIDVISFIKNKTNVSLSESYQKNIKEALQIANDNESQIIKEQLENDQYQSTKDRIAKLTEKFKYDPVKLAILSNLAETLN